VPLTLTALPAGLVLGALVLAERAGAETAVFYLFLVGIAVSAAGGLAAFGRLVDAANGGGTPPLARFQAGLAAALVAVFLVGAVSRSPVVLELGMPGLAPAAVVLGFCVLGLQALAAALPASR
jgi:hypothetical protein